MTTRRGQTTGHSSAVASLRTRTRNRTLPQPLLVANEFSMLLLPLLLLHLLLLLAWFVQPAISNFTHTHMLTYDARGRERVEERESTLEAAFVCLCCACAASGAEDERRALSLSCGSGKRLDKRGGNYTHTHTHAPTHRHTHVERDTHLRGTWEHLVKSKSIHQSVSKNTTTNIAPLRTMSGEF